MRNKQDVRVNKISSDKAVNPVLSRLMSESHFTTEQFCKFAGVSPASWRALLHQEVSPVVTTEDAKSTQFWTTPARRIAEGFGVLPEEIFPVETWGKALEKQLTFYDQVSRIKQWRSTNTYSVIDRRDRSKQLFRLLMSLPRPKRIAVIRWARLRGGSGSIPSDAKTRLCLMDLRKLARYAG